VARTACRLRPVASGSTSVWGLPMASTATPSSAVVVAACPLVRVAAHVRHGGEQSGGCHRQQRRISAVVWWTLQPPLGGHRWRWGGCDQREDTQHPSRGPGTRPVLQLLGRRIGAPTLAVSLTSPSVSWSDRAPSREQHRDLAGQVEGPRGTDAPAGPWVAGCGCASSPLPSQLLGREATHRNHGQAQVEHLVEDPVQGRPAGPQPLRPAAIQHALHPNLVAGRPPSPLTPARLPVGARRVAIASEAAARHAPPG
jgi:hypothetical protein